MRTPLGGNFEYRKDGSPSWWEVSLSHQNSLTGGLKDYRKNVRKKHEENAAAVETLYKKVARNRKSDQPSV